MKRNDKLTGKELVIVRSPANWARQDEFYITKYRDFDEAWKEHEEDGLYYAEYANKAELVRESGFEGDEEGVAGLLETLAEFSDDEAIIEYGFGNCADTVFYRASEFTREQALREAAGNDTRCCLFMEAEEGETYGDFAARIFSMTRGHRPADPEPDMFDIAHALDIDDWDFEEE